MAIHQQQELLIEMSDKANAANFFTHISHEFRTPPTLILAPIEELLASVELTKITYYSFYWCKKM